MLKEKIDHLPQSPGVYQFKDKGGSILYVGKAKRLRNRVRSYFQSSRNQDGRLRLMISKIDDLEVIVTDSEAEALILENNLIKRHQPRYNVMYRDDKTYPYICLTKEDRPRVYPTRTVDRDGSKYFGPYDHVGHMRRMLETIRTTFGLCTCAVSPRMVDKTRGAPKWGSCFDDYLKSCSGDLDPEIYRDIMDKVERLLNGKTEELIRNLKEEMQIASDALAFEEAARLRDSVESLEKYNRKMKMVSDRQVNRDLFAVATDPEMNEACGVLFKVREGKLIGKFHRYLKNIRDLEEPQILQSFVEEYYTGQFAGAFPDEVYVSHDLPEPDPLLELLWKQMGRKVPIHRPKIGEKRQMVNLAFSNARLTLGELKIEKAKAERQRIPQAIKDLQDHLRLQRLPRRIECFDISNLQGTDSVASMVCFIDGKPSKKNYKRFHIKTVTGADDYASMKEVVQRRYKRAGEQDEHLPDLVVLDGGKGQLNIARKGLEEIGAAESFDLIALAKRLEEVFLPGYPDPVMIPKTSSALKLLQRIRDEAHRFAVDFHKRKRSRRTFRTELHEIDGVGEKRADMLLRKFGSVRQVSNATLDELQEAAGKKTGKAIHDYFQNQ